MTKRDDKRIGSVVAELSKIKNQLSVDVPVWTKDELLLKLQDLFAAVISKDPVLAVENKYEVELWNYVFKHPISQYQQALRQKSTGLVVTSGRSASEIQHRLALLLERAAGFYLSLIHKLLCQLPDHGWHKSVLSQLNREDIRSSGENKYVSITDHRWRWGAGRFDLDDTTLRMQHSRSLAREEKSRLRSANVVSECGVSPSIAPTILSRGAQLPDIIMLFDPPISNVAVEDENEKEMETKSREKLNLSLPETLMYLIQHAIIHLGDIARYQQNYTIATSYYAWAWIIDPTSGHSYNQLAILESIKPQRQLDSLCYFYVRAIACTHPFPAAMDNLDCILGVVVNATKGIFDRLFFEQQQQQRTNSLTNADEFGEFFQTPFPLLLRFHALSRSAPEEAIRAAHEFTSAVVALHQVLVKKYSTAISVEKPSFPVEWSHRINELTVAFSACCLLGSGNNISGLQTRLRSLQTRLTKLVIVHTYGVQTNWQVTAHTSPHVLESGLSNLRRCLLYTTVQLFNWLSDFAFAVLIRLKEENVTVDEQAEGMEEEIKMDSCLPLTPLLVVSMWLKTVSSSSGSNVDHNYLGISDEDLTECAPPLNESAIKLLNHLSQNCDYNEETTPIDLLQLPEFFILQGYSPLGFSNSVHKLPASTKLEELLSTFLLNGTGGSSSTRNNSLKQITLLLTTFRTLASSFPNLLNWTENEGFVLVNRPHPILPPIPQPLIQPTISEVKVDYMQRLHPVTLSELVKQELVMEEELKVIEVIEQQEEEEEDAKELIVYEEKIPLDVVSVDIDFSTDVAVIIEDNVKTSVIETVSEVCDGLPTTVPAEAVTLLESVSAMTSASPLSLYDFDDVKAKPTNGVYSVEHKITVESKQRVENQVLATKTPPTMSQQQCGAGLIVNAELARFIQEQASQVKARQNSMMTNSQTSGVPICSVGSSLSGCNNSIAALPRSMLRKDLPPRFLRRLQAELQEKEQLKDSTNLSPLDQPAPLAMKESEGNCNQQQLTAPDNVLPYSPISTMMPAGSQMNVFSTSRPPIMMQTPFGFPPAYQSASLYAGSPMHHTSQLYYPPPPPNTWVQTPPGPQANWLQTGPQMLSPQKQDQQGRPMPPMMWRPQRPVYMSNTNSMEYPVSACGGLYSNLQAGDQPNKSIYP